MGAVGAAQEEVERQATICKARSWWRRSALERVRQKLQLIHSLGFGVDDAQKARRGAGRPI